MKLIDDDFDWEEFETAPEIDKVIPASAVTQEVIDSFYGPDESKGGYLPWAKAADKFRLRPGEVTLYAGPNSSGKSAVTTNIALSLLRQDERVLIASMEMLTWKTMRRMNSQASGSDSPAISFINKFQTWTDGRLWLYNHHGDVKPSRLLGVLRYAAKELGITHVIIDSLMKCVRGTDDYNGQKDFVNSLCDYGLTTLVHCHLVCHVRKGDRVTDDFDKFAIKGASEISDLVDNVVLIKRNKAKEQKLEAGRFSHDSDASAIAAEPDVFLDIDKQRHFSWEGRIGLWFDLASGSYVESRGDRVQPQTFTATPFSSVRASVDAEQAAERSAIAKENP